MSRFSQAEAEAAGWAIEHKRGAYETPAGPDLVRKHPATIVASKFVSLPGQVGHLVHEEAESIGKLLERIHSYEQHLSNVDAFQENTLPAEIDQSNEVLGLSVVGDNDADGVGDPVQSVVFPIEPGDLTLEAEVATMTDAEWSARSRGDVLVVRNDDGSIEQRIYAGGTEDVKDAESLRLENKKAIEDRRAAEAAVGPTEQVEFDTVGLPDTPGIGAGGVLVVREGESPADVIQRKDDLKKMNEEGRVGHQINTGFDAGAPDGADKLAGLDVSIQERSDLGSDSPSQGRVARILDEPENEQDAAPPAPHLYPEGVELPQEAPDESVAEEEAAEAQDELEDEALEARDDDAPNEGSVEELEAALEDSAEEDDSADSGTAPEAEVEIEESEDEPAVVADEEGELDALQPASRVDTTIDYPGDPRGGEAEAEDEPAGEPGVDFPVVEDAADEFTEKDDVEATDAAKAKATELGVDLENVKGTGKDGRIIAPDVEAAADQPS